MPERRSSTASSPPAARTRRTGGTQPKARRGVDPAPRRLGPLLSTAGILAAFAGGLALAWLAGYEAGREAGLRLDRLPALTVAEPPRELPSDQLPGRAARDALLPLLPPATVELAPAVAPVTPDEPWTTDEGELGEDATDETGASDEAGTAGGTARAVVASADRRQASPEGALGDLADARAAADLTGRGEGAEGEEAAALRPRAEPRAEPRRRGGEPARIVIVIDDLGLDRRRTRRTAALPGPLSLAFLPYAEELPAQTAEAAARGHEIMVHLPMEPTDARVDPGPDALRTGLPAAENVARLERALARVPGRVGVNNHMGSRFTASEAAMRPVLAALSGRGLFWLDSRTHPRAVGHELAGALGLPRLGRDVFLDHLQDRRAVEAALRQTERLAETRGLAVAIGHPHDVTLAALEAWLPGLAARGFTQVTAGQAAERPLHLARTP